MLTVSLFLKQTKKAAISMIEYDPQKAGLLAQICELAYQQALQGKQDAKYDGRVKPPDGYRQIAALTAPELVFTNNQAPQLLRKMLSQTDLREIDLTNLTELEKYVVGLKKVYFGLALEATDGSGNAIIAFRGTKNIFEWILDAAFIQVPVPMPWFADGRFALANAHFGFLFLYAFLAKQIMTIAAQFREMRTCYVAGHSLGGALAIFAALTLGVAAFPLEGKTGKVQLYNYGAPRVGDSHFVAVYNHFVPWSYRIINLCDIVPLLPPETILDYHYYHIGTAPNVRSFIHQTGDIGQNHALDIYQAAVAAVGVVTNSRRNYPCSGL
jgi:triacylglycerol lipase